MKFENAKAKQYYEEITQIHKIEISASDEEFIFTEEDGWKCLQDIYKRNYKTVTVNMPPEL